MATQVISGLMRSSTANANRPGHGAAHEFDEPGADQISQAFDVTHDARDQRAGLGGVVEGDRQAADVRLHLQAQFGDHALRGLREELRERVGSPALHRGGAKQREHKREQKRNLVLVEDVVHDEFCGGRKHQTCETVDHHQQQTEK